MSEKNVRNESLIGKIKELGQMMKKTKPLKINHILT